MSIFKQTLAEKRVKIISRVNFSSGNPLPFIKNTAVRHLKRFAMIVQHMDGNYLHTHDIL